MSVSVAPFCAACTAATTGKPAPGAFTLNGLGTTFYGGANRCPACGSIEQIHWIALFFVPLLPLGRYRMIYTSRTGFHSRYYGRAHAGLGRNAGLLLGYPLMGWGLLGILFVLEALGNTTEGYAGIVILGVCVATGLWLIIDGRRR
ncbi:MAG TPA: hypothetical protein VFO16_13690 [Pseudonocardiaceae bacterium]|nr:hypothetical protein [Pseudonocardiaceae bacterium]